MKTILMANEAENEIFYAQLMSIINKNIKFYSNLNWKLML